MTDVDNDVTGWEVTFGAALANYNYTATVNADGSFQIDITCSNLDLGDRVVAYAQDDYLLVGDADCYAT